MEHIRKVHVNGKRYGCMCCKRKFKSKEWREDHEMRVHGEMRDWKCVFCARRFPTKRGLEVHIGKMHKKEGFAEEE